MINDKLVSIVVPCFQAEHTIIETLDDIFNQKYQPLEVIVVNDGSTDKTQLLLNEYHKKISILNQENKGAAAARNNGFKKTHGTYILFCDSDVKLKPHMVSAMVSTLEKNPKASYCYSSFVFGLHTFDLFPFDADKLRKENYISTMSLIRREHFIGFDESLKRFQDWDLWRRMLDRGYQGVWYPERLFSAPMHRKGISKFSLKTFFTILKRKILK